MQWIEQHLDQITTFAFLWVLSWILSAVWQRFRAGSIHPPFDWSDIRFSETLVSGRSDRKVGYQNWVSRGALSVKVLRDALLVEPAWIFKWIVRRDFHDLEHYVPVSNILSIQTGSRSGQRTVRVEIRGRDGATRTLELEIRKQAEFLAALESLSLGGDSPHH